MTQGPNVKQLIVRRMSQSAIPKGGGLKDAIDFLSSPERMLAGALAATEFVREAIEVIRSADEPNQWRNADDETIAAAILRSADERMKERLH